MNLSTMTKSDAVAKLEHSYVQKKEDFSVVFEHDGKNHTANFSSDDIQFTVDPQKTAEAAYQFGRSSNTFKNSWNILCSFFKKANYLYMTKAYVECNVLETKEYSLVRRNKGYTTFMMKNQNDIGEDFKVIEDIIGKIDSYEVNQENSYLIRLQNKKEKIVRFNNYNQFTLFSLDVD